jgi:hypothetical protein
MISRLFVALRALLMPDDDDPFAQDPFLQP